MTSLPLHLKCAFCSAKADSKEHWPPKWTQGTIDKFDSRRHTVSVANHHGLTGYGHQKGARAKTLKIVCETCNNNWMSKINEDIIPIIKYPAEFFYPNISQENLKIIMNFSVLQQMIIEFHDYNTVTITNEEREKFKEDRSLFRKWCVSIAFVKETIGCSFNHIAFNYENYGKRYNLSEELQSAPIFDNQVNTVFFGNLILFISSFKDESPYKHIINEIKNSKFTSIFPSYEKSKPIHMFKDVHDFDHDFRNIVKGVCGSNFRSQTELIHNDRSGRRRTIFDF